MTHTHASASQILSRIRRMKGQVEAVERALETGAPCGEVLMLAASIKGAVHGLVMELVEDHLTNHISDPATDPDRDRGAAAAELIEVMRRYMK